MLAVALSLSFASQAQTTDPSGAPQQVTKGKISGKVIDGSTKTIESATITLHRVKDSSVAKMSVADKTGNFEFSDVPLGSYFVSISAVGHDKGVSGPVEISAGNQHIQLKTIELVPQAKAISGVTVTSKRPLIEQKAGKTLINVEASPTNTGLNALEVLEKSPGVSVDNDGNISLKGKQGVMILIDGKPTYMSGADLAALLKNMQSSSLDQIEIMTNPPAKYDAAGNSGIINIKTKKGIVKGTNGSANGSFTQGKYSRFNGGLNLNYRNEKINLFGGYNGGKYEGYNKLVIDRKIYEADNKTIFRLADQVSRPHFEGVYHNLKAGLDYYFTKKTVLGMVVNANLNDNEEDPTSTAFMRFADRSVDYRIESDGLNTRKWTGVSSNINFKHTIDSTGREITADLDYAFYDNRSKTQLTTKAFNAAGTKQGSDVVLQGNIPSNIDIYSAKVDYLHPLKKGMKLEAGFKTSYVTTDNQVVYMRNSGAGWSNDDRSNHFVYKENINAVYAIFSRSMKKWELSAGLRLENTSAKGRQIKTDSSFKRDYTNLFPNLGLSYNANEKNQFNFSYSRRITRPDYDDLNPFVFFLDSLTYGQGNPYLQPQFTHNFELSHTFNKILTTTLNYTQTDDIITQMLKQEGEKTFQTQENFNTMKQLGLAVSANVPVRKWWSINFYANVFNNHYTGLYQNGAKNDEVDLEFTSLMTHMTHSFTIGKKGWNAELSGWYRTKGADGLLVINDMGAMNAAVSKTILKKQGTLKLGLRDVFYTQQFSGYARYSNVDVNLNGRRDTRQVTLSLNYRFGKKNIAPERRRRTGATDEQNRVNTGGGN